MSFERHSMDPVSVISIDYSYMISRCLYFFFFLMIRRPPRSTLDRSSAASDVYKRQLSVNLPTTLPLLSQIAMPRSVAIATRPGPKPAIAVSYTHLRAHETVLDLVCRLLLEKKNETRIPYFSIRTTPTSRIVQVYRRS